MCEGRSLAYGLSEALPGGFNFNRENKTLEKLINLCGRIAEIKGKKRNDWDEILEISIDVVIKSSGGSYSQPKIRKNLTKYLEWRAFKITPELAELIDRFVEHISVHGMENYSPSSSEIWSLFRKLEEENSPLLKIRGGISTPATLHGVLSKAMFGFFHDTIDQCNSNLGRNKEKGRSKITMDYRMGADLGKKNPASQVEEIFTEAQAAETPRRAKHRSNRRKSAGRLANERK